MDAYEIQASRKAASSISAIVLAAGLSRRMGAFKMILPWRETTVIGQVAMTLGMIGLHEIIAVTGHRRTSVEAALAGTGIRCVFNPDYASGEMLSSIQVGLAAVDHSVPAVLVCLGDQPHMEATTVRAILDAGERNGWQRVVIPSYRMRAGHPILIPCSLRPQIMNATETLRAALRTPTNSIDFLVLDTPTILADLDTPEDYASGAGARSAHPTSFDAADFDAASTGDIDGS